MHSHSVERSMWGARGRGWEGRDEGYNGVRGVAECTATRLNDQRWLGGAGRGRDAGWEGQGLGGAGMQAEMVCCGLMAM